MAKHKTKAQLMAEIRQELSLVDLSQDYEPSPQEEIKLTLERLKASGLKENQLFLLNILSENKKITTLLTCGYSTYMRKIKEPTFSLLWREILDTLIEGILHEKISTRDHLTNLLNQL